MLRVWGLIFEGGTPILGGAYFRNLTLFIYSQVRVGEVGGTTLGFYGGVFSPDGRSILGHGYQGAFRLWNKIESQVRMCIATVRTDRYTSHSTCSEHLVRH